MKYTISSILFLILVSFSANADFVFEFEANDQLPDGLTLDIRTDPSLPYNFNVDLDNDGNPELTGQTGNVQYTYFSPRIYTVRITGNFPNPYLFGSRSARNRQIIRILEMDMPWLSMKSAFREAKGITFALQNPPDLSQVTDFTYMCGNCEVDVDLSDWDMSSARNLDHAFWKAAGNIRGFGSWDVSNVTNMRGTFRETGGINDDGVQSFVPDTGDWITSSVENMSFMFAGASGEADVGDWNLSSVTNMSSMFYYSTGTYDVGSWDVSNITDMSGMFFGVNFTPNVSSWVVSNVTNMSSMFSLSDADPDVSGWDISNVESIGGMFSGTCCANPDVENWDTSSVTTTSVMFASAEIANPNVSKWDTSNVVDMSRMFIDANVADPEVENWDTSSVTTMNAMFAGADEANPDVTNWDVSNVTDMFHMFLHTPKANPDLQFWDVQNVSDMTNMFGYFDTSLIPGFSTRNYDRWLSNLASQNVMSNVTFNADGTPYCESSSARDDLINLKGWTIIDAGPIGCYTPDARAVLQNIQTLNGYAPELIVYVENSGYQTEDIEVLITLDPINTSNISWTCDFDPACVGVGGTSGEISYSLMNMPPDTGTTFTIHFDTSAAESEEVNILGSVSMLTGADGYPADNMFNKNIPVTYELIFQNGFE